MIEKDKAFDKKIDHIRPLHIENKSSYELGTDLDNGSNFNIELKNESPVEIEISFISQISYHISQKKKEFNELKNYKKALEKDTKAAELKRN